jgi:hypothetical protein
MAMCIANGCTSPTGERIVLTQENLARIHKLGVNVQTQEPFSVRYQRDKMSNVGAAVGSFTGLAVESAVRSSVDAGYTDKLKPVVGQFDPQGLMSKNMLELIQSANLFKLAEPSNLQNSTGLRHEGMDGLLVVVIRRWGMIPCSDSTNANSVEVSFDLNAQLFLAGNPTPVWERALVQTDGDCHTIDEFKSKEGLLLSIFSRAIEDASGKLVNEIRFPQ